MSPIPPEDPAPAAPAPRKAGKAGKATKRTEPRKTAEPLAAGEPRLLAVSDLHIGMADNRPITESLRPGNDGDWLIVAGDVGEMTEDIEWALRLLSGRFAKVIWTPGNHELWSPRDDRVQLRGRQRYEHLVAMCGELGVVTPEDPFPVWEGDGGPAAVAPLFIGYDYTFRAPGTTTKEESLARAYDTGVVCTDEYLLHPDPYPTRDAWCRARVRQTERRLAAHDSSVPLILVNHYPLVRQPTDVLWHPEFAQWCGTVLTGDWHRRFSTSAVVYGHLHIPRTTWHDGVRFEEVSIGYPREWRRRGHPRGLLRQILPYAPAEEESQKHEPQEQREQQEEQEEQQQGQGDEKTAALSGPNPVRQDTAEPT